MGNNNYRHAYDNMVIVIYIDANFKYILLFTKRYKTNFIIVIFSLGCFIVID